MRKEKILLLGLTITFLIFIGVGTYVTSEVIFIGRNFPMWFEVLVTLVSALFISFIYELFRNAILGAKTQPYNVAIIGFPRSGKTTLIVSLFQEIFNRKVIGIKATLKGDTTIERLNQQIAKKESGLPVGPTNDQTMFAYRTNIETSAGLYKKNYRVEFGDYPGEYSQELSNSTYFNELKKSEFFKWCIEANAYIFIVDLGKYLQGSDQDRTEFVAESSKAIRESWQHFLDYNEASHNKIRRKPVLLIFNKMDLLMRVISKNDMKTIWSKETILERQNLINKIGFSENTVPQIHELDKKMYDYYSKGIQKDFQNIISYLKSEINHFHILHTSSFGTINDKLAGVNEILKLVFREK